MKIAWFVLPFLVWCIPAFGQDDFHVFTDKKRQKIEAIVLEILEETNQVRIKRKDGRVFAIQITMLCLDDQQHLKNLLVPPPPPRPKGEIGVFGMLPGEKEVDVTAAEGIDDIVDFGVLKDGWLALRENGDVIGFSNRFRDFEDVEEIFTNTVWWSIVSRDGLVLRERGEPLYPDVLKNVTFSVHGNSHAAALHEDGTVSVWGFHYAQQEGGQREAQPAPGDLGGVVQLASVQHHAAALDSEGRVYVWDPKTGQIESAIIGAGITEISGGVFSFFGLDKEGKVYRWGTRGIDRASVPREVEGEGPFVKIRCSGATNAAQREDGTWLAWGKNGAGVVDFINEELGAVQDLLVFTEPVSADVGYVVWIK